MTQTIDILIELERVARVAQMLNDPRSRGELDSYRLALEARSAADPCFWRMSRLAEGRRV